MESSKTEEMCIRKFLPEKEQDGFLMDFLREKARKAKATGFGSFFPSVIVVEENNKTKVECLKYTLPVSFVVQREVLPLVKSIRIDRLR